MIKDLKKCPFCNGIAIYVIVKNDAYPKGYHAVICKDCSAEAGAYGCIDGEELKLESMARNAWNKRV